MSFFERRESRYEPSTSELLTEAEEELSYLWVRALEEVEEQDADSLLKVAKQLVGIEGKVHDLKEDHDWKVDAMNRRMCPRDTI